MLARSKELHGSRNGATLSLGFDLDSQGSTIGKQKPVPAKSLSVSDKPKRARRSSVVSIPPVEIDPNRYRATDDDLPVSLWPEPDFEEKKDEPAS